MDKGLDDRVHPAALQRGGRMYRQYFTVCVMMAALAFAGSSAAAPLFESETTLAFTLKGPLTETIQDRKGEPTDSPMILTLADGPSFNVKVRQRGNFRRQRDVCSFPPLRLSFQPDQVHGTVFEGQHKLKLVTHCRQPPRYQQNVFKEYLAYKIFNLLTDASFKVRLVKVQYVDTSGRLGATRYGFLIEDVDAMAVRLHGKHVKPKSITYSQLDDRAATRVAVFEYLIGNLDFSLIYPHADEDCCHNVKLLSQAEQDRYLPIPYDFDLSGIVNASYAGPPAVLADRYHLNLVTDRLYRGFCSDPKVLNETLAEFNAKRKSIYALLDAPGFLGKREERNAARYFDSFFDDIKDSGAVQRNLMNRMRGC